MNELRVLLACQWRIWCNGWRRESRQRGQRLSMAFVLPLFIALLFGSTLYFLHYSGLVEMLRLAVILPEARQAANRLSLEALAISSTATFLVISLSALEQAFETFFQAPDLALLLSAPISRRGIFVIKFVANMRWDASMILVLSLPIWLAFSVWLKAPFLFYLALPIAWGLLLVLVSGIGTLLAMTLARIISAARLRQFVISFTMGVGLLLVIGIQGLITRVWQKEQIVSWLNVQWLSRQTWLPSVWLSRALAHFMIGEYAPAWPWLLRLALGAAIGYLAAYIAALRLYRDGWSQAQEAEQRSRRRSKARAVRGQERRASAIWSLVHKDLRLFARQPTQWYQAILGSIVVLMVLVNFSSQQYGLPSAFMLSLVMSYVGANTFATNLSLRGMSREGLSWWLVQVAPVSDAQLLWSKFLTAFLPTALYGGLALIGMQTAFQVPVYLIPVSLLILTSMIVGMIVVELAVGIWRADFERAVRTRNADVVAVLVSQVLGYLLIAPGLFALSMLSLLTHLQVSSPLIVTVVFALGTLVPASALYIWAGWRYGLYGLRALRLSEEIPAIKDLCRRARRKPEANAQSPSSTQL